MKYFPGYFQASEMSGIDARKLEDFYEQFAIRYSDEYGYGHFVLACYAAVPAVLTADLIHKLWLNFKTYEQDGKAAIIHPVAPADILLSSLVEEVGVELYEMSEPLRKGLLQFLKEATSSPEKNKWGFNKLETIAEFLRDYAVYDFTPGNADDDAFREAQQWTALSYLEPSKAFAEVAQAFEKASTNAGRARYKDAIEKMSSRFALNIVKDGAEVPKEVKAVTALTSAIRDVLRGKESNSLNDLIEATKTTKNLLTDEPIKKPNVINLEVHEKVTDLLNRTSHVNKQQTRKLKALIVGVYAGVAKDDALSAMNSAIYFHRELSLLFQDEKIEAELLHGEEVMRAHILDRWQEMINQSTDGDNLLLYIAGNAVNVGGHCCIECSDLEKSDDRQFPLLRDEQIAEISKTGTYASLTVIVQASYAATHSWFDVSNPKNILFASSSNTDTPVPVTVKTNLGDCCAFTYALIEALSESPNRSSNRQLFFDAVREYVQINLRQSSSGTAQMETPQLLAYPQMYEQRFLGRKQLLTTLQNALRHSGYLHNSNEGHWGAETSTGLLDYIRETDISDNLSKQQYISHLLAGQNNKEEIPVFLLVFSDPEKKLPAVAKEQKSIEQTLKTVGKQIELVILVNPTKQQITTTIADKKYRSRIQLFYYSGFDNLGNFALTDEVMNLFDFVPSLSYQPNLKLFVANTCRSYSFAQSMAQAGVQITIGAAQVVDDDVAANFGDELFQCIAAGHPITDFVTSYELKHADRKEDRNWFKSFTPHWFKETSPLWKWEKFVSTQEFKKIVEDKYRIATVTVRDDLQKNRWGGNNKKNGLQLSAVVTTSTIPGFYMVEATVRVVEKNAWLTGQVAFFLHDSFANEIQYAEAINGEATLQIGFCYEAFTLAAYTEEGIELELDLNKLPGNPPGFNWNDSNNFKEKANEMARNKTVRVPDDLQKGRWGGRSENQNKILTAKVTESWMPKWYSVELSVRSTGENKNEEVAIFLHDSFQRPVRFTKMRNGMAVLKLTAYEAFTVGVLTENGTELELDLNEVPGYPEGFYAKASPAEQTTKSESFAHQSQSEQASNAFLEETNEDFVAKINLVENASQTNPAKHKTSNATLYMREGEDQIFICDRTTVVFAANTSTETRKDVLHSSLLAQLAANKKTNGDVTLHNWYNNYINVLTKIGWTIEASAIESYEPKDFFELQTAIKEILTSRFGKSVDVFLEEGLQTFKKMVEDQHKEVPGLKLFEESLHHTKGFFQVAFVEENDNSAAMQMLGIFVSAKQQLKKILFVKLKKDEVRLEHAFAKAQLNKRGYAPIRQAVIDKLGSRVETSIQEIMANRESY